MAPADFWQSTPREFFNRLHGFNRLQKQVYDQNLMNTKLIMYWITINNPYIEKKDKPRSFEDFLDGDKKKKIPLDEKTVAKMAKIKDLK